MKIKIMRDKYPFNPRKESYQVFTWYINPNRYFSGDEVLTDSSEDIWGPDKIRLPIYAYIHGDVVLSTTPFSDAWDSGLIGFACTDKAAFLKEFCGERAKVLTKHRRAFAQSVLEAEIDEFNAYLSGDVWGYVVEDDEGNVVDSCWGYYGRSRIEAEVNQRDGELGVTYDKSVGSIVYPDAVYWDRTLWCYFSPYLPFRLVRSLVKTIAPFAQKVLDGYSEKLDPTHHEWRGCYTKRASLQWEAICKSIQAEEYGWLSAEATKHLG